jgi:hypothetical protein
MAGTTTPCRAAKGDNLVCLESSRGFGFFKKILAALRIPEVCKAELDIKLLFGHKSARPTSVVSLRWHAGADKKNRDRPHYVRRQAPTMSYGAATSVMTYSGQRAQQQ